MTDLTSRINQLSDSDLVEAGSQYFAASLGARSDADVEKRLASEAGTAGIEPGLVLVFRDQIAAEPESYAPLMRMLLCAAAEGDRQQQLSLANALDGVGLKQMMPDPYLVSGLGLLVLLLSRKTKTSLEIEVAPGTRKIKFSRQVQPVSAASSLGKFFDLFRTLPGGK